MNRFWMGRRIDLVVWNTLSKGFMVALARHGVSLETVASTMQAQSKEDYTFFIQLQQKLRAH